MNRILRIATGETGLVVVTIAAASASVVRIVLGPGAAYANIFPPPWLGLVAAAMVVPVIVLRARGSDAASLWWAWGCAVFFFGASGGFILDAFRAFFALTRIPAGDFGVVDLAGAVSRGIDLIAALVVILYAHATTHREAPPAGRKPALLWLGILFAVPYPLLKMVWWVQGPSVIQNVGFPAGEIVAFGAAAIWIVVLVGLTRPNGWSWTVVCGGMVGSGALLSMGALMVFGFVFQAVAPAGAVVYGEGGSTLLVFGVYGTWLGLGAVMLAATLTAMETLMNVRTASRAVRP